MRAETRIAPQQVANLIVEEFARIVAVAKIGGPAIYGHPGLETIASWRRYEPAADALIPWSFMRDIRFWLGW